MPGRIRQLLLFCVAVCRPALAADGPAHAGIGGEHLLFLLLLVLAAPLAVQRGGWLAPRPWRAVWVRMAWIVTMTTLAHAAAQAVRGAGELALSAQWTGTATAATIALAACHAWRPLFARGDAAMALAFGLVHGLALSSSLAGGDLSPWQNAQALFAFNLGIEAMQLAVLALVLPPLLFIATACAALFDRLRRTLAAVAALLACAWIAARLGLLDLTGLASLGDTPLLPALAALVVWAVALGVVGGVAARRPV